MAGIELSAGFMSSLPGRILDINSAPTTFAFGGTGGAAAVDARLLCKYPDDNNPSCFCAVYIMKGTMPSDFSTLTGYSARSADVLVAFKSTTGQATFSTTTQQGVNPSIITTINVNASAGGTATWFWWMARPIAQNSGSPSNPSNSIVQQIIGSVGSVGSGADLEMANTTIVSGNPYRIRNLKIQFPSSWTY